MRYKEGRGEGGKEGRWWEGCKKGGRERGGGRGWGGGVGGRDGEERRKGERK